MWAVVPIKTLARAKQRLAPLLGAQERQGLVLAMAADVLAALACVRALAGTMVVSREPQVEALARRYGAHFWPEEPLGQGYTCAVTAAAGALQARGAEGMIQLPGDVPLVTSAEIEQLLQAHGPAPAVTIVPDRNRQGTNAILCTPPQAVPLQFGENSFQRHLDAPRRQGICPRVLTLPGLGLDIDTPADLDELLARAADNRTRQYLARSGIIERLAGAPAGDPPNGLREQA